MKLFLVRHGETDWKLIDDKGVQGWARSFAPLTPMGRLQIDVITQDYRLQEAEAILCSSYARALESGARISRVLNQPLYVEYDLHEWLPQMDPMGELSDAVIKTAREQLTYHTGFIPFPDRRSHFRAGDPPESVTERRRPVDERQIPAKTQRTWESLDEVRERVLAVLRRYSNFKSVVVVSHAVVMASLLGVQRQIDHAEIVEVDLDLNAPLSQPLKEIKAPRLP